MPIWGAAVSFIGGAAVSAAPTKLLVHFLVGALLALASGKAESRAHYSIYALNTQGAALGYVVVGLSARID